MLNVRCDECDQEISEPGAIYLSPPDGEGRVIKAHICVGCAPERAPKRLRAAMCTGTTARWCPVHGDCTCTLEGSEDLSEETCPLHSSHSDHGEWK